MKGYMYDAIVYIVDDEFSIRDSLEALIKLNGYRVASYESANAFLKQYDPEVPGCLILDARMPSMTGFDLQEMLREKGRNIPIIFISGNADISESSKAFRTGALDFLEKPFDHEVLLERVDEAIRQDIHNRSDLAEKKRVQTCLNSLTPREREVLNLIINSHTNKEAARKLAISYRTVDAHRARVMQKMQVENVAALVSVITKYDLLVESGIQAFEENDVENSNSLGRSMTCFLAE